jgi:hypothetical protein
MRAAMQQSHSHGCRLRCCSWLPLRPPLSGPFTPSPSNLAKVSGDQLAALITQHLPAHDTPCVLRLLHRFPHKN